VQCFRASLASTDPQLQATGCLTIIAFYYLLRVGEYTKPRFIQVHGKRAKASRTQQFAVKNVGFFKNGKIVSRASPLSLLLSCDAATLKITNQKNGRMGETIHQECTGKDDNCPVRALAIRVHHVLSNNGTRDNLLCDYRKNDEWHAITSSEVRGMVKNAARILQLQRQAIDPDLVGSHSLRAGGAMALKLHGYDDTTIQKMGRWTSSTFLQYIHNQIAYLHKDMSKTMSIALPFLNIAAIEEDLPQEDPELVPEA
jgi:hypothetical protein